MSSNLTASANSRGFFLQVVAQEIRMPDRTTARAAATRFSPTACAIGSASASIARPAISSSAMFGEDEEGKLSLTEIQREMDLRSTSAQVNTIFVHGFEG